MKIPKYVKFYIKKAIAIKQLETNLINVKTQMTQFLDLSIFDRGGIKRPNKFSIPRLGLGIIESYIKIQLNL